MEYYLKENLKEDDIRKLRIGDIIFLSGLIYTMRDQAHLRVLNYFNSKKKFPVKLQNGVIYHCGPVVRKKEDSWEVLSCGPTTSMRMERYEPELIEKFKIKMIIGKGGMGENTLTALNKFGAVYTSFTGGAGVLAAEKVNEVKKVYWLDLGIPEALWIFKVENFGPLIVTMDSKMNNMYKLLK